MRVRVYTYQLAQPIHTNAQYIVREYTLRKERRIYRHRKVIGLIAPALTLAKLIQPHYGTEPSLAAPRQLYTRDSFSTPVQRNGQFYRSEPAGVSEAPPTNVLRRRLSDRRPVGAQTEQSPQLYRRILLLLLTCFRDV